MINQVWTIEKFLIKKAIKSAVGTTSTYITNPLSFRWKTRNPVSFPCPGRGHTCFARPLPELPACQIRQYTDIKWAACLNLFRSNVVMFRGNISISLMISKRRMDWIQFLNFVLQHSTWKSARKSGFFGIWVKLGLKLQLLDKSPPHFAISWYQPSQLSAKSDWGS